MVNVGNEDIEIFFEFSNRPAKKTSKKIVLLLFCKETINLKIMY